MSNCTPVGPRPQDSVSIYRAALSMLRLHRAYRAAKYPSGRYYVDLAGRRRYLDGDRDEALIQWAAEYPYWRANVKIPSHAPREITVGLLAAKYSDDRQTAHEGHLPAQITITAGSLRNCRRTCAEMVELLGSQTRLDRLTSAAFSAAAGALRGLSMATFSARVNDWQTVFNWGKAHKLLEDLPDFGPDFRALAGVARRRSDRFKPAKLFEVDEIKSLLAIADPKWRAMILFAVNTGAGNQDIAFLTPGGLQHIEGEAWYVASRRKTGEPRQCHLWTETTSAIEAVTAIGPARRSADCGDRIFVTPAGCCWWKSRSRFVQRFNQLQRRAGVIRSGRGFYGFRHSFRTFAGRVCDTEAIERCMGHAWPSGYVHAYDSNRLRAVAAAVYAEIWGAA